MAQLRRFGLGDMASDGGEYSLDGTLRIDRLSSAIKPVGDARDEFFARAHRVRLNGGTVLLVKRAADQQRQLGGEVRRIFGGEPVAQRPKHNAEGAPGCPTVRAYLGRNLLEPGIGRMD
jgi:hypothetical protein